MNIGDIAGKILDFGVFQKGALAAGGMVKAICVPGGGAIPRKETDALAEWAKGFGAKGLAVTKVVAGGQLETGVAKFLAPFAAELIAKMSAKEGDLICFAADSAKVVHRVLGELRIKLAKERGMIKEGDWKWVWVVDFPAMEYNAEEKRWDSLHHPFNYGALATRTWSGWRRTRPRCCRRRMTSCATGRSWGAGRFVFTARRCNRACSSCSASMKRRRA